MNLRFKDGIFVVVAPLTIEDMKTATTYCPDALKVRDENGNQLYAVSSDVSPMANISGFGFTSNCLADNGQLQFAISARINPNETLEEAKEKIKVKYGSALVAAAKYLPIVKQQIKDAYGPIASVMSQLDTPEEA